MLYFSKSVSFLLFLFFVNKSNVFSQELFPHAEPASNIPKGVLAIRIANEGFNEIHRFRSQQNIYFMFGLSSKLMLTESFSFSNHHASSFSKDFIKTDNQGNYYTTGIPKGNDYPYSAENLKINLKYRFLSRDAFKRHFRMSTFLEFAGGNEAHDEAEPSLQGDNGGIGADITATRLSNKVAASLTLAGVIPQKYHYRFNDSTIDVKYGKSLSAILSFVFLFIIKITNKPNK